MQVVRAAVGGARANRHSHRVAVDPYGALKALQQATVNLFSDMGIQPANLQRDLVPATASQDKAGPLSKIVTPSPNTVLAPGVVTISGTASDTGGVVSMVEVSTDGGQTWWRATGTDHGASPGPSRNPRARRRF
jgi:Big-like domain-containing protein